MVQCLVVQQAHSLKYTTLFNKMESIYNLQESKIHTHMKMWERMAEWEKESKTKNVPSVFVGGNRLGVQAVLDNNYAYLMEVFITIQFNIMLNMLVNKFGI
jgi:hypothetical protein